MNCDPVVHIVDDEAPLRSALALLARSAKIKSQTYASATEFMQAYRPGPPGCLVLDVRMPGMSGIELLERLQANGCSLPTIVMTGHGDVPMAVRAMRAGALDFIEKPFQDHALLALMHAGIQGSFNLAAREAPRADARLRIATLTVREREVLSLLIAGTRNKVIADRLDISPRTVELHRAHIMDKTGAGSLSELLRMSLRAGVGEM